MVLLLPGVDDGAILLGNPARLDLEKSLDVAILQAARNGFVLGVKLAVKTPSLREDSGG